MYAASNSQRVRDAVSVQDVIGRYHQFGRSKGRTTCPLHGGTHDNLGYNTKMWHCFVCGAKGDAIGFVMQLYGITYADAIAKIAKDFGVVLVNGNTSTRELHKMAMIDAERVRERLRKKRQHTAIKSTYWEAFDEYARLDINKRQYAPKSPDETLNPLFVEALQNITYAEYLLSKAEEALNEYERNCHDT